MRIELNPNGVYRISCEKCKTEMNFSFSYAQMNTSFRVICMSCKTKYRGIKRYDHIDLKIW